VKITGLETVFVKPRWVFLKMHTDEGIVGLGEPTLEGRSQTVAAAVQEMGRFLIGEDPRMIEHNWQTVHRRQFYRGGPILSSALSGVEQAMWDILGKSVGEPVYRLLGGPTRRKIRVYRGCGGRVVDGRVPSAEAAAAEGFTAIKTGLPRRPIKYVDSLAFLEETEGRFAAMRETVGPEVDIAIDFHGASSPAMSIRLAKVLEPYYPMFIEEPVLPGNVDELVRIARSTSIPIATGERLFTKWGFREVVEKQAAAILQPDVSHAGGISEVKKIAAMAECYYGSIAPHCPLGPIALAACIQLDASIPNFLIQELGGLGEGYLKKPFEVVDGHIELPTGPGLGIELDEEALADKVYDGSWDHSPSLHEDGSVGDA
jgi:galactonate dehydratase